MEINDGGVCNIQYEDDATLGLSLCVGLFYSLPKRTIRNLNNLMYSLENCLSSIFYSRLWHIRQLKANDHDIVFWGTKRKNQWSPQCLGPSRSDVFSYITAICRQIALMGFFVFVLFFTSITVFNPSASLQTFSFFPVTMYLQTQGCFLHSSVISQSLQIPAVVLGLDTHRFCPLSAFSCLLV